MLIAVCLVLFFYAKVSVSQSIYFTETKYDSWYSLFLTPIHYWRCHGYPTFELRKIDTLDAAKEYFLKSVPVVPVQDEDLDIHMPLLSIFENELFFSEFLKLLSVQMADLDQQKYTFSEFVCNLLSDADFFRDVYQVKWGNDYMVIRSAIDVAYRVAYCIRGIDTRENCPDVCRKKRTECEQLEHSTKMCRVRLPDELSDKQAELNNIKTFQELLDKQKEVYNEMAIKHRLPLSLFQKLDGKNHEFQLLFRYQLLLVEVPYCECSGFYRYDLLENICVLSVDTLLCAGGGPCQNNGQCFLKGSTNQTENSFEKATVYCVCPPAFKGQWCNEERNPCTENLGGIAVCGEGNHCLRWPSSYDHGFICLCGRGYHLDKETQVKCVDIDECATGTPCRNGGSCVNTVGSYKCKCLPGFEGPRCQIPPPLPSWSDWSEWGTCQKSENVCIDPPMQVQTRECQTNVIQQKCVGPRRKLRYNCPDEPDQNTQSCKKKTGGTTNPRNPDLMDDLIDHIPDYEFPDEESPDIKTYGEDRLAKFEDVVYIVCWIAMLILNIVLFGTISNLMVRDVLHESRPQAAVKPEKEEPEVPKSVTNTNAQPIASTSQLSQRYVASSIDSFD